MIMPEMSQAERIFQAILYELLAILVSFGLIRIFPSDQPPPSGKVILVFVGISLIAMIWSYIYNLIFDHFFTGEKLARPLALRIYHIVGFEFGLLLVTLPILMWLLDINFWQALLMDIGLSLMIMLYGMGFYWLYDWVRARIWVN